MKKRESVSPVTSSPARMIRVSQVPTIGMALGRFVPTLVAASDSSSQGRRYPVNPKASDDAEEEDAGEPGHLARLAVGLGEGDAEKVDEDGGDHQRRRPAVDGADEPAERELGRDPGDAGVGLGQRRPVVERQQHAGGDLDAQEKKDRAPRIVAGPCACAGGLPSFPGTRSRPRGRAALPSRRARHSWDHAAFLTIKAIAFGGDGQPAQGRGRRPGDVEAVLVVPAFVAGAVEALLLGKEGDVAVEVGADADEGDVSAVSGLLEKARLVAPGEVP